LLIIELLLEELPVLLLLIIELLLLTIEPLLHGGIATAQSSSS
jgi:hypothetical protein